MSIIVCDLEATCWPAEERGQTVEEMEIIEIGAVRLNDDEGVVSAFSTFVRPKDNPQLTDFCQQLTHITQRDVDAAPTYPEAVSLFDEWLGTNNEGAVWGSWGRYDRNQFLAELDRHDILPRMLSLPHLNLKRAWRRTTRHKHTGLFGALKFHGYAFEGVQHRGIDDARNIARLVRHISAEMLERERAEWCQAIQGGGGAC